ncbi:MAG TPA: hypothetical protein VEY33_05085, partial [Gemmatimonadota bacterium]|nr:hypothetical protein [Gemmatimonadota bacterium]
MALVQLLSITHWTHFAAMVISLALLGFGASGSALAIGRRWVAGHERRAYAWAALLTGVAYDPAYRLAARIPFDAFELIALPRQLLWLALTYLVLAVPFFLAGTAVALALWVGREAVGRVYAANLLGSGAGAVLGLALLSWLPAERLPAGIAVVGLLAVAPLARWGAAAAAAGLVAVALVPAPVIPVSQYKEGTLASRLPEARVAARDDGPLGRLEVIESPALRTLPGASLALREPVPPRPVLYLDGQTIGPRAVARDTALWSMTTSAAAFALPDSGLSVLLVGVGGGGLVWLARAAGARSISVVDPDARLDPLLDPEALEGVRRFTESPRGWLHASSERFDRVVVGQPGSLGGSAAGMSAAGADYLFTVEGFEDLWDALDEDGVLAITRWVLNPPRDVPRLLATARQVLDDEGLEAGRHVALVRGWSTATLLVSRRPLEPGDVAALRSWCGARWFDLTWAPGAPAALANHYNLLDPDWFRLAAEGLLEAEPERFARSYVFDIAPVTDSAPFFHHFLRVGDLVRLWRAEGRLSLPYLEWGIVAQWLVLLQAIPIAAVLILLPLFALPRASKSVPAGSSAAETPAAGRRPARGALFSYFALLGFAFMVLEISAIQRLILFLAQPTYAMTAVLASFLVFAGLGSAVAPRVRTRLGGWAPFAAIAVLALVTRLLEGLLWDQAPAAPIALRMLATILLLAPLAFAMG